MKPLPIPVEVACATADDFINQLHHERWRPPGGQWASPWVFRGQRLASWPLTAPAWRTDTQLSQFITRLRNLRYNSVADSAHGHFKSIGLEEQAYQWTIAWAQARAESELIHDFLSMAEELAYPAAEDKATVLAAYENYPKTIQQAQEWSFAPAPSSLTVLAQHYGIPTRGMDWSRSPLIAALFAARSVLPEATHKLAVWAADTTRLRAPLGRPDIGTFVPFASGWHTNKNLVAQQALVLHPANACSVYLHTGHWPSIEATAHTHQSADDDGPLIQFTLPHSQVGGLLRFLWSAGVSSAHVFPSLDSVASALAQRWAWQHAGDPYLGLRQPGATS